MIAHAIQGRDIERNGTLLQLSTLVTPLVYPCADGDVVLIANTATLQRVVPWMLADGTVGGLGRRGRLDDVRGAHAQRRRAGAAAARRAGAHPRLRARYRKAELFAAASPTARRWRR
jgi:hypothetical protein